MDTNDMDINDMDTISANISDGDINSTDTNSENIVEQVEVGVGDSGGGAGDPLLLGRKSVLMGIAATIGALFDSDGRSLAGNFGTVNPTPTHPGRTGYAPKWAPSTAYSRGQQVISPSNDVVSAKAAHKSSRTYAADASKWNLSRTYAGAAENGINALKSGCAGNGVTDDTAALHAIRDSAAKLGVPVYLPKATYRVSGLTLSVANQSWVLAKGATLLLAPSSPHEVIAISAPGVSVQGGKLDGNKARQKIERSGMIVNAAGATVSGVEATNCYGNGISLGPGATGCLIEGNYCHSNGTNTNAASGIYLRQATLCRVIGNRCEHNGTAGNAILYDGNGIYLAGGAVTGYNLVANNQCSYNARRGIKLQELGATITGNVCVLNSTGIGVTNTPNPDNTPTVITGNMIKGSDLQGLQLDNCAFLTISGNTITDSGDHGVGAALGCNQVSFTGNTIARSARNGANLVGIQDWNISGNMILDNGKKLGERFGLALADDAQAGPCKRVNIVGNTSANSEANTTQTHGFAIGGSADRISLVGNVAGNGLAVPYEWAATVSNLTVWANTGTKASGLGAPWTSFAMGPGSFISGTTNPAGFRLMQSPTARMGFWGQAPVTQPASPPADATDLASAIALVNDLKAKLRRIGLTA